jgi:lysozyme family protein
MLTKEVFKQHILPVTLKHEGGYANVSGDTGGETYRGISKKSNPDWPGWAILEKHKPLTRGDIINDSALKDAVCELYFAKYFQKNNFHLIRHSVVALQMFDFAVHGGFSVTKLQKQINKLFNCELKEDGILGPITIEKINRLEPELLAHQIIFLRREHLQTIVQNNPIQAKFEKGWNNRIDYMRHIISIYANV